MLFPCNISELYKQGKMPDSFAKFKKLRKDPKWFEVLCDNFVPGVIGKKEWERHKIAHQVSDKVTVSDIGLVLTILENKWDYWKARAKIVREEKERDEKAKKLLENKEKQGQNPASQTGGSNAPPDEQLEEEEIHDEEEVSSEDESVDEDDRNPRERAKERQKLKKILSQVPNLPRPRYTCGKKLGGNIQSYQVEGLDRFTDFCNKEKKNRRKFKEKVEPTLMKEWKKIADEKLNKKKPKAKPKPRRPVYNELRGNVKSVPKSLGEASSDSESSEDEAPPMTTPVSARPRKKKKVIHPTNGSSVANGLADLGLRGVGRIHTEEEVRQRTHI